MRIYLKYLCVVCFQGQGRPAYLLNLVLFIYLNLCQTIVDSYLIKERRGEAAAACVRQLRLNKL